MSELCHYGVKGMRWGVRRAKTSSGDGAKNSPSIAKKAVNKFVNSKRGSKYKLNSDPEKERNEIEGNVPKKQRAIERVKKKVTKESAQKAVLKGARVAGKLATASMVDDIFYGGAGKKIAKETVKQTGRAVVTAYTMANGGYDIHWYDK